MSTQLLTDALNDCIDRLANGQTIEQCLRIYPELADDLRPLLQIGQASRQNRADALELSQMRSRLDSQIDTLIANTDFESPTLYRLPQGALVLVASMILVVLGGLALFSSGGEIVGGQPTETLTITPEITIEASPTIAPTETPSCAVPDAWQEYRVRSGDTLDNIALVLGLTSKDLRDSNCLTDGDSISEGQTLFVPELWEIDDDDDDNDSEDEDEDNSEDD